MSQPRSSEADSQAKTQKTAGTNESGRQKALSLDPPGATITLTVAEKENEVAAVVKLGEATAVGSGDEGSRVDILSPHTNEKIGEAVVEHTEVVALKDALAIVDEHEATYEIDTTEYLISRLAKHNDTGINNTTEVQVIILTPLLSGSPT